jgi:hypothetical protein
MKLTDYYEQQASVTDDQSDKKLAEKEEELKQIFVVVRLLPKEVYRLGVLGCGDKRHLKGNTKVFEDALGVKVANTTYDLDSRHLGEGAVQHDCTVPLPDTDFDITYAHVLLKFIPAEKQLDLVKNSIDALADGGIAIHVIDNDDLKAQKEPGMNQVLLDKFEEYLKISNPEYLIVNLKYGIALVIRKKRSE